MYRTYKAAPDIDVLTTDFPIPGLGFVPINAFVLHGAEPILVDSGPGVFRDEFMAALRSVIDPADLAWLWLTHADPDHTGALATLLAENDRLRVATNFLTGGILGLSAPPAMERFYLVNPGQQLVAGDRTLTAVRPPTFDNPATMGFHDRKSGALVSSDCFGALLAEVPDRASDLPDDVLRRGQVAWATIDAPWLHNVDRIRFAADLDRVRAMEPSLILSSHLPAATGRMTEQLLASVAAAPDAEPFVAPDQAALEQMMAQAAG